MIQFNNVYNNKRVLISGNTGFKGSWLTLWLNYIGATVFGISKSIPTKPSNFEVSALEKKIKYYQQDIRDFEGTFNIIKEIEPEFVFHLAAQPLVRESYKDPKTTIETNVLGTTNILESLRRINNKCTCIVITSDKCYENVEWIWGYRETDALGGEDPYSASKGAAELVVKTYARSFFRNNSNVKVSSARAGNVIGGGDWAEYRIVPDAVKSWVKNQILVIRNPLSTRPWQHVLEPLSGYLLLGKSLYENEKLNGEPFNFGPNSAQNYSVERLLQEMSKHWKKARWKVENDDSSVKEAGLLKLNCDKALHTLGWLPNLNFEETVEMVISWYRIFYENGGECMYDYTLNQIIKYIELARKRNLVWVQ